MTAGPVRRLVHSSPGRLTLEHGGDVDARSGELLVRVQLGLLDERAVASLSAAADGRRVVGGAAAGVLASNAGALTIGSPVVVWPELTCRRCAACRAKVEDACGAPRTMGLDSDGTLAERIAANRANIVRVPARLGPVRAVAATRLVHAWRLVSALPALTARSRVLVDGAGPLAEQVAALIEARGGRVDPDGAGHAVSLGRPVEPLIDALAPGGTIVVGDEAAGHPELDLDRLVARRLTVAGRGRGGPGAFRELVGWLAESGFDFEVPPVVGVGEVLRVAPASPVIVNLREGVPDAG